MNRFKFGDKIRCIDVHDERGVVARHLKVGEVYKVVGMLCGEWVCVEGKEGGWKASRFILYSSVESIKSTQQVRRLIV